MSQEKTLIVDRAPLSERQQEEAMQMARDLVIPPRGDPYDRFVPFTLVGEGPRLRPYSIVLSPNPRARGRKSGTLSSLVDMAGATSGGEAMGLRAELRDMARRHPQEFIEETGGDLARQTWERLAETLEPHSETAREGLLCKMHQLRPSWPAPSPRGWNGTLPMPPRSHGPITIGA